MPNKAIFNDVDEQTILPLGETYVQPMLDNRIPNLGTTAINGTLQNEQYAHFVDRQE